MSESNPLVIDRDNLHLELERQAVEYRNAARRLAKLQLKLDEAESEKDVVEAELQLDIRMHPSKFGLEKTTEKAIDSTMLTLKPHKIVVEKVNKLKYDVAIAKADVIAFDQKKRMLEKMVDLWLNEYWAEPRVKGDVHRKAEAETKRKVRREMEED